MREDPFDLLAFVWRSAFDADGERKTVIIGEGSDFRAFAALGGPDPEAPFFCPRERSVDKGLLRLEFPSGLQLLG